MAVVLFLMLGELYIIQRKRRVTRERTRWEDKHKNNGGQDKESQFRNRKRGSSRK